MIAKGFGFYWFNFVKFCEASSKYRNVPCEAYLCTTVNVRVVMNNEMEKMLKDLPWSSLRYCRHINVDGLREMTENAG